MSNNEASPVSLKFVGKDYWGRAVFKGSNGRWYKTTDVLLPEAPHQMTATEQTLLLASLHSTDSRDGEPGWPVDVSRFSFSEGI